MFPLYLFSIPILKKCKKKRLILFELIYLVFRSIVMKEYSLIWMRLRWLDSCTRKTRNIFIQFINCIDIDFSTAYTFLALHLFPTALIQILDDFVLNEEELKMNMVNWSNTDKQESCRGPWGLPGWNWSELEFGHEILFNHSTRIFFLDNWLSSSKLHLYLCPTFLKHSRTAQWFQSEWLISDHTNTASLGI